MDASIIAEDNASIITTSNHNSKQQHNSSNWDQFFHNGNSSSNPNLHSLSQYHSYHRQSTQSLASSVNSEETFLTALEQETTEPITASPSFLCLEDVMEEEDSDHHQQGAVSLVPSRFMANYPPKTMTAARLALTSDIGMLRRNGSASSCGSDSSAYNNNSKFQSERDHAMASAAIPMSRSFASPRLAVATAFAQPGGVSTNAMDSAASVVSAESDEHSDMQYDQQYQYHHHHQHHHDEDMESVTSEHELPLHLGDLADDVQLHILSFLTVESVRSIMAANHHYRSLMLSPNAQMLWSHWCQEHWSQFDTRTSQKQLVVVDDLSLPTAARPSGLSHPTASLHQQANLSLLLSMAQPQPTEIDEEQLNKYVTWRRRLSRRRHRLHTMNENSQPLLRYFDAQDSSNYTNNNQDPYPARMVVQFTGRVGQGDRCVRSNCALPRPTLLKHQSWMLTSKPRHIIRHNYYNGGGKTRMPHGNSHSHSLIDLFCRSARAVISNSPAWRPFVAPFFGKHDDRDTIHLTPRFVSYFEVSILEPTADFDETETTPTRARPAATDCVAVGLATEYFDWHARMPGWDSSSFGYHGDDGGIFHSSGGMLRKFGPSYGRGDVVGCGIDYVMQGIFFTLNGQFLGYGWTGLSMELLMKDMYPVVGIDTNDWIHCNYGTEPFQFDLKSMVVRHEDLVHQSLVAAHS